MEEPTNPAEPNELAEDTGPTARRRYLGQRLLELRSRAGLTGEDAGNLAGISKATVSRYERGKGNVRWNYVDQLCRAYAAPDPEREELVQLAKGSKVTDAWWVPFAEKLSDPMRVLVALEDEASRIHHHSVGVVPGLLQTPEYAAAIKTRPASLPAGDIEDHLSLRMLRQKILDRPSAPVYHVVLDEAVLRRQVGDARIMAAQIEHLIKRAGEPNITLQVLPFAEGAHSDALTTFIVFCGANPDLDVVFIENPAGSLILDTEGARNEYGAAFTYLRREALDTNSSTVLMAEARQEHLRHQS
ncbi:helix-turn-helix transcriptional regulator [Streptomyces sp. NPDC088124]|uniref:helix-turn-helix domain-containing protein n=1 Tax=Streptomyces sp. NPDC088124 TaxID=3154654 RepID=UPI00343F1506